MKLTSPAFEDGKPIPQKFTDDGDDISPELSWEQPPDGVSSYALICDDPDAPTEQPWVHWVIWNIPADATGLPEGVPREPRVANPQGAMQGKTSFDENNIGYGGPAPPPGHGTHHYHFKLYALDHKPESSAGDATTKQDLLNTIEGHVLGEAELIGTYER